jgi:hypothetical protein
MQSSADARPSIIDDRRCRRHKARCFIGFPREDEMPRRFAMLCTTGTLALLLAACGGGGSGIGSTPVPPIAPTPTPTPSPASAPFGVKADTQFPTVGHAVDIRWNSSAQAYEVRFPDEDWERLTLYMSSVGEEHYPASSQYGIGIKTPHQYTKLASIFDNAFGMPIGRFAFGLPTAAGDVPTTGSATYDAQVWGDANSPASTGGSGHYEVSGTAKVDFNFGAGTLSGHMDAKLAGTTGTFALPRYDFVQTVFSVGSTSFSGSFSVPGSTAGSAFSGQFNGPQAAELMANWKAPFADPAVPSGALWGTMSGVWIGKKQ